MLATLHARRFWLLGFAVAVAYWPGALLGSFLPRWSVIAIGVPLCSKVDLRALPSAAAYLLVFLLALAAVSLLGSPYPLAGVEDLAFIWFLIVTAIAAAALVSIDDVMLGFGAGFAVSAVLGLLQFFHIWNGLPEASSPSGLFFNSEVLGETAALVTVWAVIRRRITVAVAAALCIAMTGSRVGAAAVLIGLLYAWRPSWRVLLPVILGLIGLAFAAVLLFKFPSAMHRIILWGASLMHFTWAGRGLGWGSAAFPVEEFTHSDAIQALVELGIFGLAFAALPIMALRQGHGNNAERALLVAACVEVCLSFPLHFPATGFLAALALGVCAATRPRVCDDVEYLRPLGHARDRRWSNAYPRNEGAFGSGDPAFPLRPLHALDPSVRLSATGARAGSSKGER